MTEWADLGICVTAESVTLEADGKVFVGPPPDVSHLAALQNERAALTPRAYGSELFEAVFVGELADGYTAAVADVDRAARIRLQLASDVPMLHSVWWESLTAKGPPPTFLGHSYRTPFSRHLAGGVVTQREPVSAPKLKVLVVISNPTDLEARWSLPPVDEPGVVGAIQAAMKPLSDRIEFEFQRSPASVSCIRERLADEAFHVLHILGHGAHEAGRPCLLLEDSNETTDAVDAEELGELVMDLPDLRLVVLSSCRTDDGDPDGACPEALIGLSPAVLAYGVPAVVAVQDCIGRDMARVFTWKLYETIGRSKTGMIDEAVNFARQRLYYLGKDSWEWSSPVLFMAGDGVLFEPLGGGEVKSLPPRRTWAQHPEPRVHLARSPPQVSRGKRAPEDVLLLRELVKLELTRVELIALAGDLNLDVSHVEPLAEVAGLRQIVGLAMEQGTLQALKDRVEARHEARNKHGQATLYDLSEERAVRTYSG